MTITEAAQIVRERELRQAHPTPTFHHHEDTMTKTPTRIYVVHGGGDADPRLVNAATRAQAIRHVTQPYTAEVASQTDLVNLLGYGIKVEDARGAES